MNIFHGFHAHVKDGDLFSRLKTVLNHGGQDGLCHLTRSDTGDLVEHAIGVDGFGS